MAARSFVNFTSIQMVFVIWDNRLILICRIELLFPAIISPWQNWRKWFTNINLIDFLNLEPSTTFVPSTGARVVFSRRNMPKHILRPTAVYVT